MSPSKTTTLKSVIKKYLKHFSYFYSHLGYRTFVALGLSLMVGVLDGFGLAMFLPLLQMVDGDGAVSSEGLGGLSFLVDGLNGMGIELTLTAVLVIILFFFSLKGIAKFGEAYYNVLTQQYFIKKLRYDNVNKLSAFSYKAFVTSDPGRIQNTLSGEVGRLSQAYKNYFLAVQSGVMVFVYVFLAFLTNPQFAVLVAIGGGLSNFAYHRIYKKTKAVSKKVTAGGHVFQGLLIQEVAFFKYLKATGLIDDFGKKLKRAIDYIERSNKKIGFYNAILTGSREPIVVLVVVLVIVIQVSYFSQQIGVIVLSLLFFYRCLTSLVLMQSYWNNFLNMSGSLENMTEFTAELNKHREDNGSLVLERFSEGIDLEKVNFGYHEDLILKDVSLHIEKDKTYAFVGESGSGKTTLVNLIAGLMPINAGAIRIDGVSYSEIEKKSFKKRIGYITQEPVIFNDTIYNNVTQWAEPTTSNKEKFWKSLEKAAIADFVYALPEKENSLLGSNGVLISGGQKQRISIARELNKEIDILIMDEATSALDSETEKAIQENIDLLKGQYTILIVAHRLSTIKSADQVVLLSNGRIEALGSYQQLIDVSHAFKKMIELQEV